MKMIIALLLLTANSAFAQGDVKRILLENTDVLELSRETDAQITVAVSYPGKMISTICGLQIRGDSYLRDEDFGKLLTAIDVKPLYFENVNQHVRVRNHSTIDIDLAEQTYVDGVVITAKDGSSIQSAIQRVMGGRKVIILGRSCD